MLGWLHIATSEERMDCAAALAHVSADGTAAARATAERLFSEDFGAQHMTLRLLQAHSDPSWVVWGGFETPQGRAGGDRVEQRHPYDEQFSRAQEDRDHAAVRSRGVLLVRSQFRRPRRRAAARARRAPRCRASNDEPRPAGAPDD